MHAHTQASPVVHVHALCITYETSHTAKHKTSAARAQYAHICLAPASRHTASSWVLRRSMTLTQEHPCPRPPQAQLQATALPRRCGAPERQYGIPHLTRSATAAAVLPQGTTGEVIRADDTATNSSTMQLERPHTMIAAVCQQCPVCWR
jgi:hypothetical protein